MSKILCKIVTLCLGFLSLVPLMCAQATDPVAALRQQLTSDNGAAIVQVDGIRAATKVLVRPIDNRIANGAVQSRGALDVLRNPSDIVLHPGDAVRVTKVETAADSKSDILRISVVTGNNAVALLAFVVPKGSLGSMSEAQLKQLVTPVLRSSIVSGEQTSGRPSPLRAGVVPAPPPPPPNPARTVVDLPPAAPGYPPLHASAPAMEGCWWTPFVSEMYALEMLVQHCAPGSGFGGENDTFVETALGIGVHAGSNPGIEELLRVLTKPATQPIPAAIRQQFVLKEKDQAVRTNCVAKLQSKGGELIETYSIGPTGPYAKLKKFNKGEDSEDPCPGLGSDDNVGRSFLYIPTESKTKFLLYTSEDAWPLDLASIHFLPAGEPTGGVAQSHTTASASSTPEPTGGTPQHGRWINAGKVYPHDLSDDAVTAGNFNFNAENKFEPATLFVACDGRVAKAPKLIFRVAVPRFPGYQPSQPGSSGTLFVGSQKREAVYDTVATPELVFLEIQLTPAEIGKLAFEDEVEVRGISFAFMPTFLRATITVDLPPATLTLTAAIQACHVNLPPHTPSAAAAVAPSQVQHLELAKVALGMSSDQVRAALGPGFQFFPQPDTRYPRLAYLAAVGADAAYAVTMIDGQVQGFNYFQSFPPGAQPLQANLIAGITAKAWTPIFVRPPYRSLWVTDELGKPNTKPLPDIVISPCEGIGETSFGTIGQHIDSQPVRSLERVLPRDNGPKCGVTIRLSMVPSHSDASMAESLSLSVANDAAFHSFVSGVNQTQQQQQTDQRKKANEVKNPF